MKKLLLLLFSSVINFGLAQSYIYEELPVKATYDYFIQKGWDNNRNIRVNECGFLAWNGEERIEGNCASNGLVGSPITNNYKPVNIPGNKETLCGNVRRNFFADSPEIGFGSDAGYTGGLLEEFLKIDYDLNLFINPNSNYSSFNNYSRETRGENGASTPSSYGCEIQLDVTSLSTASEAVKAKIDEACGAQASTGHPVVDVVGNFFLDKAKSVPCAVFNASIDNNPIIDLDSYRNNYPFTEDLSLDKNVCVYGPLTYDLLNSSSPSSGEPTFYTKTEIHPIEQIWYKKDLGDETVIVFATLFDRSHRFDLPEKNTERKIWIDASKRRKFARPFEFDISTIGDFIELDKKILYQSMNCLIFQDGNEGTKERAKSKLERNRDRDRSALFEIKRNGNLVAKIAVYDGDADNSYDLEYSLEDVHIDASNNNLIRGMLIISAPFRQKNNKIFNYLESKSQVIGIAISPALLENAERRSRIKLVRKLNNLVIKKNSNTLMSAKYNSNPPKVVIGNLIAKNGKKTTCLMFLEGKNCSTWEPIMDYAKYKTVPKLLYQKKNIEDAYYIEPKKAFNEVKLKNKITQKEITVSINK